MTTEKYQTTMEQRDVNVLIEPKTKPESLPVSPGTTVHEAVSLIRSYDNKICPKCHTEYEQSSNYCGKCGQALLEKLSCVKCGKPIKSDAKFCTECGDQVNKLAPDYVYIEAKETERVEKTLNQGKFIVKKTPLGRAIVCSIIGPFGLIGLAPNNISIGLGALSIIFGSFTAGGVWLLSACISAIYGAWVSEDYNKQHFPVLLQQKSPIIAATLGGLFGPLGLFYVTSTTWVLGLFGCYILLAVLSGGLSMLVSVPIFTVTGYHLALQNNDAFKHKESLKSSIESAQDEFVGFESQNKSEY